MVIREAMGPRAARGTLTAGIFDVDGVLLASPHERAWREALQSLAEPGRFTIAMYQAHVAGKPRLSGVAGALDFPAQFRRLRCAVSEAGVHFRFVASGEATLRSTGLIKAS
jgi:hypothetical protein